MTLGPLKDDTMLDHVQQSARQRGLYRFRTRRKGCDLRFGWIIMLGQDGGLCLFACST
jgi:hypothetical protein